ncbi:hypothetical protein BDZ89DRAFT_1052859 [Hymenopellis radicata]|nr:hypothetical protein BDZ89DRAFT_1052859 [Hymenopellis radicata]
MHLVHDGKAIYDGFLLPTITSPTRFHPPVRRCSYGTPVVDEFAERFPPPQTFLSLWRLQDDDNDERGGVDGSAVLTARLVLWFPTQSYGTITEVKTMPGPSEVERALCGLLRMLTSIQDAVDLGTSAHSGALALVGRVTRGSKPDTRTRMPPGGAASMHDAEDTTGVGEVEVTGWREEEWSDFKSSADSPAASFARAYASSRYGIHGDDLKSFSIHPDTDLESSAGVGVADSWSSNESMFMVVERV